LNECLSVGGDGPQHGDEVRQSDLETTSNAGRD